MNPSTGRDTCDVRIYGGWYEANLMSQLAQDVAVAIQSEFPAIIRLPTGTGQSATLTTFAELALSLMEEPSHQLFNTYRRKGKPANVRVQTPSTVGCPDPLCPLPQAKKLLKSGKCPVATCPVTANDLVYRHEQKIVDTMLSCDLIYSTQLGYDRVLLVSGDDDFLPPIRTALLRGVPVTRLHPHPGNQRASFPIGGAPLLELDL